MKKKNMQKVVPYLWKHVDGGLLSQIIELIEFQ